MSTIITILLSTIIIFATAMVIMGVGVIFSNRCLRGSCGGPSVSGPDGEDLRCAACPNRELEEQESEEQQVVTIQ